MKKKALAVATACALGWGISAQATAAGFEIPVQNQFRPLSANHILAGVSQLLAGNLTVRDFALRLWNPTKATMISTVLVYQSTQLDDTGTPDIEPEIFLGCKPFELTAHSSIRIDTDFLNDGINATEERTYVEILTVPKELVQVSQFGAPTRACDGCGVRAGNATAEQIYPLDPRTFNLPDDAPNPGQRQAAIDCLCDVAMNVIGSLQAFTNFGVACMP